MEVDVQFAAGLLDHVRRGPGVFTAGRIDDTVQVAALAVVDHGLGQVHFKADFIGEVDAPFALVAALDVGVVEGDDGNLEVFQELLDLGNGTFAAGIDEADAVVIERQVQGLAEMLEAAVFRFPFDDEDAPRIQRFFDFREVHDQVLLNFFAKMETGTASRFDQALFIAVQTDDVAVVVDEGICRMGNDEQLAPQAVKAEQILEEPAELRVFIVEKLLIIVQDRPLHIGMEVHFRFVDRNDQGQVTLAFCVDDDIVFQRHGAADGH
ncbi:unknown [Megasphaera elsdenii CAG:570]|uniref:Uncharacterized protein n=1 Tax=Megasphaera elsdenii CAG:570 TaxID=1263087 RepID=R7MZS7_MEGEL|nr:unknown [Megasphaera elsdenii CAG:570]